jgi:large subunit ribosomal protein L21e
MSGRSKGYKSQSRGKLSKRIRERGIFSASKVIQNFEPGSRTTILIDPSVPKGQPHHRYHGKTGIIREKRGRAYVVEIRDGGSTKSIISRPEHLKVAE